MLRDQPLILDIVVSDVAGQVKGSGGPSAAERLSPQAMPYVTEVITSAKPQVSELMMGRISNLPTIVLAYRGGGRMAPRFGWPGAASTLNRLQPFSGTIPWR